MSGIDFIRERTGGLFNTRGVKGGFATTIALEVFRGVVNGALSDTTPKQLVDAIKNDRSLWDNSSDQIKKYGTMIPECFRGDVGQVVEVINSQYGGMDVIVLEWLRQDQPVYYNIICNYPGEKGVDWLKKQIREVLGGMGVV